MLGERGGDSDPEKRMGGSWQRAHRTTALELAAYRVSAHRHLS